MLGPIEGENDWTSVSFGWRYAPSVFDAPRIGFDYLVIDSLSVGGSIAFIRLTPRKGPTTRDFC